MECKYVWLRFHTVGKNWQCRSETDIRYLIGVVIIFSRLFMTVGYCEHDRCSRGDSVSNNNYLVFVSVSLSIIPVTVVLLCTWDDLFNRWM